jgi:endo-1,4-beta-xylanase
VWHYQNPAWLQDGTWTRATLGPVLDNHIATVVGHYAGMISQWDVVNEAFNDDGSLRQSVWSRAFGDDYIDRAFRDAHQADPKVALFYNDYNLEWPNAKADAVFAMVSSMRRRGVPIDGVGFQMHAFTGFPTGAQLTEQFARYARIGVETAITELDVRLPVPASQTDPEAQRHAYHDAVRACVDAPNCNTVLVWGFTDKYSWIPEWFPGFGAATVFDQRYTRKPAWSGVLDALTASSTPRATR